MLDVSASGCLLVIEGSPIAVGTTILLELSPSESVAGQVVRQTGNRLGIEFLEQLTLEALTLFSSPAVDHLGSEIQLKDRFGRRVLPLNGRAGGKRP
jgi:hypothetical protein